MAYLSAEALNFEWRRPGENLLSMRRSSIENLGVRCGSSLGSLLVRPVVYYSAFIRYFGDSATRHLLNERIICLVMKFLGLGELLRGFLFLPKCRIQARKAVMSIGLRRIQFHRMFQCGNCFPVFAWSA